MELQQQLSQWATRVERNLDLYLVRESCIEPRLTDAMRYALLSGGKRIRPALVYMSCQLCGGSPEQADRAAAAIEAIHCYSLVHDDLPAMDDDELRRGRPTCHIAFDEATAILAGDALQSFAFELLSETGGDTEPARALQQVRILARAGGSHGMVMGQAFDLAHVGGRLTLSQLQAMHAHKTGRLITASVMLGATAAGCRDQELLAALQRYGDAIGLAFQVQDDLLDIEGDTATLGKPQGSDEARNKPTYPALLGIDGARAKLKQLYDEALNALKPFGISAAPLAALANFIVTRDH